MDILSKFFIYVDLSLKDDKLKLASVFLFASSCFFSSLSYADDVVEESLTQKNRIDLGGAIRMRFDYDPDRDIRKLSFDTAIVNLDFYYDQFSGHVEHRILGGAYPYTYTDHIGDINFTKKAYLEYTVDKEQAIQVGLNQVPIGFQPYYTSTVIESIAYIAGIEDLYRLGVKYDYKNENHEFLAAYYAANPWQGKGTSRGTYYSNQIVSADDSLENGTHYEEKDALAVQYNYTQKADHWISNYGVSGYYSKLKSKSDFDENNGERKVIGLHYGLNNDRFSLKLISLYNHIDTPFTQTTLGSYDGTFNIANQGVISSIDINYKIPKLNIKDINDFNVYGHYSRYDKSKKDFLDSQQFVLGSAFTFKKNIYIATEWLFGKNNPYIGGSDYGQSLAIGGSNQWENQVNINIGYYF